MIRKCTKFFWFQKKPVLEPKILVPSIFSKCTTDFQIIPNGSKCTKSGHTGFWVDFLFFCLLQGVRYLVQVLERYEMPVDGVTRVKTLSASFLLGMGDTNEDLA